MANKDHVELISQGRDAVQKWKKGHPDDQIDLSDFDFAGADLQRFDLARANLSRTNLKDAKLTGVILADATLPNANLEGSELINAILEGANLREANLTTANALGASFTESDLTDADLIGTDLGYTDLSETRLHRTSLMGANLFAADLRAANIVDADITGAVVGFTTFAQTSLTKLGGLGEVLHAGPSIVDVATLIRTFRDSGNRFPSRTKNFFVSTGVPKELLDALPPLISEFKYYQCFISYGAPDSEFAKRLAKSLSSRGVTCWLYETDRTPGERTLREIHLKRRSADRMIVICSSAALIRDGMLREIEAQVEEDPEKIVPISLEPMWKEKGFKIDRAGNDLKPELLARNRVDFDRRPYKEALNELLRGLRRNDTSKKSGKKGHQR